MKESKKVIKLRKEISKLRHKADNFRKYADELYTQYQVITDQYMEGTFGEDSAGHDQRKLQSKYNKALTKHRIITRKLNREIEELKKLS